MKHFALLASLLLLTAAAFAQPAFQGFETNTGDWSPITIRVPSGGGVLHLTAASGNYYAEVHNIDGDYSLSEGYPPPYLFGDSGYSYFGYATQPPYIGDFSQSIKMYIDITWPMALYGGPGVWIDESPGFDASGNYGAEHNFRLTPTGSNTVDVFVDGNPSIATIATSGWYNFQMTFQKGTHPTDLVITNMNVFDPGGHLIGTTTVLGNSPAGPQLSGDLLGPGYVWITVWPNGWAGDVLGIDDVRADLLTSGTPYFVNYYSNANTAAAPDATVRIVNDGSSGGNLYAAIYVLNDSEELQECCACLVTPDGVLSESVNKNLTANPLTGILPTRGVIKVISSSSSDPTAPAPTIGLRAWGTHIHGTKVTLSPGNPVNPASTGPYFVTESKAADSNLGASEASTLGTLCYYDGKLSGNQCTCQPEDNDY
jgi:hypothetical protein